MDVLLSHGYYLWQDPVERKTMRPYPPLGILYIASHLERLGMEIGVFDSTFQHPDDFVATLQRTRPTVVGIYANMLTRKRVLPMIAAAKRYGARVVVGGPDPANWAENYLHYGADAVAIGEGEETLAELITHWQAHPGKSGDDLNEICGVVWLETGAVRHPSRVRDQHLPLAMNDSLVDQSAVIPTVSVGIKKGIGIDGPGVIRNQPRRQLIDLDAQPMPARHLIDMNAYMQIWRKHHGQGAVSLITARGCPFHCTWCSHAVYGHSHRRRSPKNVADEVEHIISRYDPELLWYADDVFTIHKKWLREYAAELGKRGLQRPFETITREDRLNDRTMDTLADMGCYRIWVGAESGSQRLLDRMKRKTDAERVIEMVHGLQKRGIQAGMFIMLGYDDERRSDLEETVAVLRRAAPDIFLTTVSYPIKNTVYYEQVKDRIVARRTWAEGSDRDFDVIGRHSKRYYSHATRWMVNSVSASRLLAQPQRSRRDRARLLKAQLNVRLGQLGMRATEAERVTATGHARRSKSVT